MSGSQRGMNLYKILSSGDAAPNEVVDDLIAEAMIRAAGQSDVNHQLLLFIFPIISLSQKCYQMNFKISILHIIRVF